MDPPYQGLIPKGLRKDLWPLIVRDVLTNSDLKTLLVFLRSLRKTGIFIMYGPKEGTIEEKQRHNHEFWLMVLQVSFPEYAPLYNLLKAKYEGFMNRTDMVRGLVCWLTYAHRRVIKWFAKTYPNTYKWDDKETSARLNHAQWFVHNHQLYNVPMAYDEESKGKKKQPLFLGCQMCSISTATHRCTHCSIDMCAECAADHAAAE